MQKNNSQTGSAHAVVIVIAVIALIGALGFVFWNNFLKKDLDGTQIDGTSKTREFCSNGENTAAEKGTFCSTEIGIKFTVPGIVTGKLLKADNYEVFEGPLDFNATKRAGTSENVYRATIIGNDNFIFTIAQEPVRTGYVDAHHALQNTYYDQATSDLTRVNTPITNYNSTTDTLTASGGYSKREAVPSFNVGSTRFFKGTNGDAGQTENVYFAVINNKIVKISLKNQGHIGDPSIDPTTINAAQVFDELDKSIRVLQIATP